MNMQCEKGVGSLTPNLNPGDRHTPNNTYNTYNTYNPNKTYKT